MKKIEKMANNPSEVAILEEAKAKMKYPWLESILARPTKGFRKRV